MLNRLLERYVSEGRTEAMEEIVRLTRPRLLRIARRIGQAQDAEDSVQAAYHALLRRGRESLAAPVEGWLTTAVVRIAYRRKAVAGRLAKVADRLSQLREEPSPALVAVLREEADLLHQSVAALPAKYRDAVTLHHLQGLQVDEVARLLGIPGSTVKTQLRRGRDLLRSRLGPRLTHGLLAIPWMLQDGARTLGAWVQGTAQHAAPAVGGTMQLKGTVLLIAVAAAAGVAGTGLGAGLASSEEAPPARVAHAPRDEAEIQLLQRELDDWRRRAIDAERTLEDRPVRDAPRERTEATDRKPAARTSNEEKRTEARPAEDVKLKPAWRKAAKKLEVPEAALKAAVKLKETYTAFYSNTPARATQAEVDAALDELRVHGQPGYDAVLALLRAGEHGIWFDHMLEELWEPGREEAVIELAEDKAVSPFSRWSALKSLGAADTPEVREYLREYLRNSKDAGLFMSAARALGELKDADSVRFIEDKLFLSGWSGVRPHLLIALGGMGGPEARDILIRFVSDRRNTNHLAGLSALARVDPGAAQTEAARILQDPQIKLSDVVRQHIEAIAQRGR